MITGRQPDKKRRSKYYRAERWRRQRKSTDLNVKRDGDFRIGVDDLGQDDRRGGTSQKTLASAVLHRVERFGGERALAREAHHTSSLDDRQLDAAVVTGAEMCRAERRAALAAPAAPGAGDGGADRAASAEEHPAGERVVTEQPGLDYDPLHADVRPHLQPHSHTHTRLTASFPGLPGEPVPER